MFLTLCVSVLFSAADGVDDLASYVDPFIGTGATGNTYPGATLPFGMVQFTPMVTKSEWNYNSGYHRDMGMVSQPLSGFGLTAMSGTGLNDGGDFLLLPVKKPNSIVETEKLEIPSTELLVDQDVASPGYYKGKLRLTEEADVVVEVELAASLRSGMMRARFHDSGGIEPHKGPIHLYINFASPQDHVKEFNAEDKTVNHERVLMLRRASWKSHHCATDHTVFAALQTNVPIKTAEVVGGPGRDPLPPVWLVTFDADVQELIVRVGLSHVNENGALENLRKEMRDWDFDKVASSARQTWNVALGKASVEGDHELSVRYYTALYHSMLGPTLFSDVDKKFRLGERFEDVGNPEAPRSIKSGRFDFYSTFSLWDTYRTQHPLINLLFPNMAVHFAQSLLEVYTVDGHLPRWMLYGKETGCMIGYPVVNMLCEAALKDLFVVNDSMAATGAINSFVREASTSAVVMELSIFNAMIETTEKQIQNVDSRGSLPKDQADIRLSDIPVNILEYAGVSKALEYAWSDSCLSKLAGKRKKKKFESQLLNRSRLWRRMFDPKSKMVLPSSCYATPPASGQECDFEHVEPNEHSPNSQRFYVEGSPLQYTFMVPHDIPGLIDLMGGKEGLKEHLDYYFEQSVFSDSTEGRDTETGVLGGHVQGNEPGHQTPYLYNFADAPWKTQEILDKLMAMYTTGQDGLPGNDDVGQMSAWFVMSALGLYPMDPCDLKYSIGRPLTKSATLQLQKGTLHIKAFNQSIEHMHVQSVSWNGVPLKTLELHHTEIIQGGELFFVMGDQPVDFRAHPLPQCQGTIREPCTCGNKHVCFDPETEKSGYRKGGFLEGGQHQDQVGSAPITEPAHSSIETGVGVETLDVFDEQGDGMIWMGGAAGSLLILCTLLLRRRFRRPHGKREN